MRLSLVVRSSSRISAIQPKQTRLHLVHVCQIDCSRFCDFCFMKLEIRSKWAERCNQKVLFSVFIEAVSVALVCADVKVGHVSSWSCRVLVGKETFWRAMPTAQSTSHYGDVVSEEERIVGDERAESGDKKNTKEFDSDVSRGRVR